MAAMNVPRQAHPPVAREPWNAKRDKSRCYDTVNDFGKAFSRNSITAATTSSPE